MVGDAGHWRTVPSEAQILRLEIWWQYEARHRLLMESMNECRNCGNCRYIDPDIAEKALAPLKGEWYVCREGMWGADRGYIRWLRPRTIKYNLQPVKRIAHRCGVFKPLAESIVEELTGG